MSEIILIGYIWYSLGVVEGMRKCSSAETPSHLNVEIEPRIEWCAGGKSHINIQVQKGHHA